MIDFHSHVIYGVDDGVREINESIESLREAKNAGFTDIICTPHYMENFYEIDSAQIKNKIQEIEKILIKENIDINLHQANEIYITTNMVNLLDQNKACTINNSNYVLFEIPMNIEPMNLEEVIYQLLADGKIPIIAHPERYEYVQKNPNMLIELIDKGVLFQSNYGSIIGKFGKESQITIKKLLKNNFIHFLGTDSHRSGSIYLKMQNILKELKKIISEEKFIELTKSNAEKVLKNEEIPIIYPKEIKKGFFNI